MKKHVVVVVSGGVVLTVFANTPDTEVTIVDWDNIEGGDEPPTLPEGLRYTDEEFPQGGDVEIIPEHMCDWKIAH